MLARCRRAAGNGVCYGGVAVLWKEKAVTFRNVSLPNPGDFEVLVAAGSVKGLSRKLVVVACYLPPNMTRQKGIEALEYISDTVVGIKRRFKDPYLVVSGDFN